MHARLSSPKRTEPAVWSGNDVFPPNNVGVINNSSRYEFRVFDEARHSIDDARGSKSCLQEALPVPRPADVFQGPETADIRLVKYSGEISHNRVQFTHCRVFGAESTIDFSALDSVDQTPGFGVASLDDTLRPLPGGLHAVKLRNRISGGMAVGTLIDGTVAGDVVEKHAVVIPSGSPVRGRIRRMERYTDPFP